MLDRNGDKLRRLLARDNGVERTAAYLRHKITTIGTSMHSSYPQYRYLDEPAYDLASIKRQVNALRHASRRVRQQRGIGYYFVNRSDMQPASHYTYDHLIRVLRTQALRWR